MRKSLLGLGFATIVASQAFLLTPTASAQTTFQGAAHVAALSTIAAANTSSRLPWEGVATTPVETVTSRKPISVAGDPDIVDSGPVNLVVPAGGDMMLNLVTGFWGPWSPSSGADFNLYAGTGGALFFYVFADEVTGQSSVADAPGSSQVANLPAGTVVGPSSPLTGSGQNNGLNWVNGASGYVGLYFRNEVTGQFNYGYVELQTTGPNGFPATITRYVYNSAGNAITIPGGGGGGDPEIGLSATNFNFSVPADTSSSQNLVVSNTGAAGSTLNWTIAEAAAATSVAPKRAGTIVLGQTVHADSNASFGRSGLAAGQTGLPISPRGAGLTLSQNTSTVPMSAHSIACGASGTTADNVFLRRFYFDEHPGLEGGADITSVDVSVEVVNLADVQATVQLYTVPSSTPVDTIPALSSLTQIGTHTVTIPVGTALTSVNVPVTGTVSDTTANDLVVAVSLPSSSGVAGFYPGSNNAGQTHPGFLASVACSLPNPTTFAAVGFPDVHLILTANAEPAGGGGPTGCDAPQDIPWLTVSNTGGALASGASATSAIGVNAAGMAVGTYEAQLCVDSDDPLTPRVAVPVALEVTAGGGSNELLTLDLTVPNRITISATTGESLVTASGSTTTGVYFADFFANAGSITLGTTTLIPPATLSAASVAPDGSPSIFKFSETDPGINIWSYSATATTTFTAGSTAFQGTATWEVSAAVYAAMLTAPTTGNVYFPADDAADIPTANHLGTYRVIFPTAGDPEISVNPTVLDFNLEVGDTDSEVLAISNIGGGSLTWNIATASADGAGVTYRSAAAEYATSAVNQGPAGTSRAEGGATAAGVPAQRIVSPVPQGGPISGDWNEGFDNITSLAGAGWAMQNNSSPLGLTGWSQGAPDTFPSHSGAPESYISANFNNASGAGDISNWLMTPEITLQNGTQITFWSRSTDPDGAFDDRLQVRMSTAGASTNVGSSATDTGDFTTVLLEINPTLAPDGYPSTWTQYTATVAGLGAPTSGRIAFRYWVPNSGPSGNNGDYIGIDTLAVTQPGGTGPTGCDNPSTIPWLSVAPVSGSTPGGQTSNVTVSVNATGVAPGTYEALLCVNSNDAANPVVEVPVGLEVTAPGNSVIISVNPTAMSSAQDPDTTQTQTLTITNNGTDTGNFTIVEAGVTGGDKGRGSLAELYDNGPMITNPGAGAGGADVSAIQLPGTLYGTGAQQSVPNRVADDFTVPAGGWDIQTMTFYTYQTGSTTTPTITGITVRIWDGIPGEAGSNIVWGDDSTNVMGSATWTGIYRTNATLTDTQRPIMAVVANTPVNLPAGTYWVDFALSGTLASGPWAPPVAIAGQPPMGNALQSQTGGPYLPALDEGSATQIALPFKIHGAGGGSGGDCDSPSDVPWLSVSPSSGTVAGSGGTADVTVEYDSTGLAPGSYHASLCVESDDTVGNDVINVPVTLNVLGSVDSSDLALSLFSVPGTVNAGGNVSIVATVANFGPSNANDVVVELELPAEFTFVSGSLIEGSGDWTCSAAGSDVTCELDSGSLPNGAFAAVLQVNASVDAGADDGAVVTSGTVSAANTDPNPSNNDASVSTTIVAGPSDVIFANGFECAPGLPDCASGNPDIVVIDNLNWTPAPDFTGGAIMWVDGTTCVCDTAPYNFNPYGSPTSIQFFWPNNANGSEGGVTLDGGSTYAVLGSGATIGPASVFLAATAAGATANWNNTSGYLGFRFLDNGITKYGYATITAGPNGRPFTLNTITYNDAGDPITIP
jgi:uncharacterized repeat protein (TIGR01451 family)